MPLDQRLIYLVAWIDAEVDLTYIHAVVTFMAALASFWVMQCITAHAGLFSARRRGLLFLRITLASMSIALALNCAFVIQANVNPFFMDTVCRTILLFVLLAVPYALPAHLRRSPGDGSVGMPSAG